MKRIHSYASCLLLLLVAENSLANDAADQIQVLLKQKDTKPFLHPGFPNVEADYDRMKAKIAAQEQPWFGTWELLQNSPHTLNWKARPFEKIIRGVPGNNYTPTQKDANAAYQAALRYKLSGDKAWADKGIDILNAWSRTVKEVTGNSNFALAGGIIGYQFAASGEMLRDYPGWSRSDFAGYQRMMRDVFYKANHDFLARHNGTGGTHYRLNWETCNMASMIAIGVVCDDHAIVDESINYFLDGVGNGCVERAVGYVFPDGSGQTEEMGRDQPHNVSGLIWMGYFCETAWNQGIDLYSYDNNRFLRGIETVAKYNTGSDVPFVPHATCDSKGAEMTVAAGRLGIDHGFDTFYNHYVNRLGLAMPYTKLAMSKAPFDGGPSDKGTHPSLYDFFGYQTLTKALSPIAKSAPPSGVRALWSEDSVILSWWGSANADKYAIERSSNPDGPFTQIGETDAMTTSFIDKNVENGQTYYYVISANDPQAGALKSAAVLGSQRLVARYDFDGNARDQMTGRIAEVFGSPDFVAGRAGGKAIQLNGSKDYVRLPDNVAAYEDITVAAWVKWAGGPKNQRIFDFGGDITKTIYLTPASDDGLRFEITTSRGYDPKYQLTTPALQPGKWVHVAITLKGNTGTLYIDGKSAQTAEIAIDPLFTQNRCFIGKSQFANDPLFKGLLKDMRIYNYALSPAEIEKLSTP